tara:strand:+ start:1217 stop:2071 length:855 start_codon:yes stop_codon:yes gene_type:complete
MEKEAEQLKLNALNIKSILTSGSKKLNKIKFKKTNLDRTTIARKNRRMKEKVLESAKETRKNVGAGVKNLASKVAASKPGEFLQFFLLGVVVNNIENIVKFFKGDIFKNITDKFKNIGKIFTTAFDSVVGFFNPKSPELKIPDGFNDENTKKLEEVNNELELSKSQINNLNGFAKSLNDKYDSFMSKIKNNKSNSKGTKAKNTDKIPYVNPNPSNNKRGVGTTNTGKNPYINPKPSNNKRGIGATNKNNEYFQPLNKEVTDLSVKKKIKQKIVYVTQEVIVGEI